MKPSQSLPRIVAASSLALLLAAAPAVGQQPAPQFEPQVGQAGKDVIWVPTPQGLVDRMLDMAKVTPNDFLIDLGSGDGRTVITAAKRGVRALGIEYNADMVELSKRNAAKEGVSDRATFVQGDLFESDFSKATVLTMFLLSHINLKLRPIVLDMRPGTRVVSNTFDMGDWTPDNTVEASEGCTSYCRAYFWIVPAKVQGIWRLPEGGELTLQQKYQMVSGTLKAGNVVAPIKDGKLAGDEITFSAGGVQYTGRVDGNVMEGVMKGAGQHGQWRARRSG
jgi:Methyltransferase domain